MMITLPIYASRNSPPLEGWIFSQKKDGWSKTVYKQHNNSYTHSTKTKTNPSTSQTPNSTFHTPTDTSKTYPATFRRSPYTFCKGSDTLYNLFRYVQQKSDWVIYASDGVVNTSGHAITPIPTVKR